MKMRPSWSGCLERAVLSLSFSRPGNEAPPVEDLPPGGLLIGHMEISSKLSTHDQNRFRLTIKIHKFDIPSARKAFVTIPCTRKCENDNVHLVDQFVSSSQGLFL